MTDTMRTTLWRKQIFPLAIIQYGAREVAFTTSYLQDVADAFASGALDIVPFFSWSPDNPRSYDPGRLRGRVIAVEVVSDGMDALIDADEEGDRLIAADPEFPVAPSLIEDYHRADGARFRAVLRRVCMTKAPMLIGLRPWRREPDRAEVA